MDDAFAPFLSIRVSQRISRAEILQSCASKDSLLLLVHLFYPSIFRENWFPIERTVVLKNHEDTIHPSEKKREREREKV